MHFTALVELLFTELLRMSAVIFGIFVRKLLPYQKGRFFIGVNHWRPCAECSEIECKLKR